MYSITKIEKTLSAFGFTDKEAALYLELLKQGDGNTYSLATRTGLKHSTIYVTLKEMVKKGYAYELPNKKKPLYRAKQPETFYKILEGRLNDFQSFIPVLNELKHSSAQDKGIYYYIGEEGIEHMLEESDIKNMGSEVFSFYGTAQYLTENLNNVFLEYSNKLKKAKIKTFAIAPASQTLEEWRAIDDLLVREVKVMDLAKYYSNVWVEISNESVQIVDLQNFSAVKILNKEVIQFFKQIFKLIWDKY